MATSETLHPIYLKKPPERTLTTAVAPHPAPRIRFSAQPRPIRYGHARTVLRDLVDSTQHPSAQCSAFSRKTSSAAGSAFLGWFICKLRDVDG